MGHFHHLRKFPMSFPSSQPLPRDTLFLTSVTIGFISVQFSRSVVSDSLRPRESQHARPPRPSPYPGVHSNSRPSSHLILCRLSMEFFRQEYWSGLLFSSSRGSSQPRALPTALQVFSLPAEPSGKHRSTLAKLKGIKVIHR